MVWKGVSIMRRLSPDMTFDNQPILLNFSVNLTFQNEGIHTEPKKNDPTVSIMFAKFI